jgi:GNAT superfamily N-acetyltransferase
MVIKLRKETHPDAGFYYRLQFEIYHEPYLIWSRETWAATLASSDVYHIEINGRYGGNVILEDRGKGERYLADFSLLPEFQGKGFGKAVLEKVKDMGDKLTAFTRKETLQFFLKSGFVLKRTMRNYFSPGVDRYYIRTP